MMKISVIKPCLVIWCLCLVLWSVQVDALSLEQYILKQSRQHYNQHKVVGPLRSVDGDEQCPPQPNPIPLPNIRNQLQSLFVKLDSLITTAVSGNKNVSFSSAVIYRDDIIWSGVAGFLNPAAPMKGVPDLNTKYRIGSITKVISTLMLLKLRDEGRLSTQDTVNKYWDSFQLKERGNNSRGVTFWQLARQLSGLPSGSPCNYFFGCNITTDQAFKVYSDNALFVTASDSKPHYSDGAFAVLARGLEKLAGKTWEAWTQENLLDPLKMKNSGFYYTPNIISELPTPYLNGAPLPSVLSHLSMGWAAPTGQMYSSVNDLANLVKMLFRVSDANNTNHILLDSSLREMTLFSFVNRDQATAWSVPWEMVSSNGYWVTTKGGFFPGYTSWIGFVPKLKLGVVAMNADYLALSLGLQIFDLVLPALVELLLKEQPGPVNPGNLTSYVGTYSAQIFQSYTLTIDVKLGEDGNTLEYGIGNPPTAFGTLVWDSENDFKQFLQTPSQPGLEHTCIGRQMSANGEVVSFQSDPQDPTNIVSMHLSLTEPFFGLVFLKK